MSFGIALAKDYSLTSPNGKLIVTISNGVNISVSHQGNEVVSIKADLNDACTKVLSVHTTKTRNERIVSPFYRQKEFNTAYRQADVALSGGFGMEVRAYNEVALRGTRHQEQGDSTITCAAQIGSIGIIHHS